VTDNSKNYLSLRGVLSFVEGRRGNLGITSPAKAGSQWQKMKARMTRIVVQTRHACTHQILSWCGSIQGLSFMKRTVLVYYLFARPPSKTSLRRGRYY